MRASTRRYLRLGCMFLATVAACALSKGLPAEADHMEGGRGRGGFLSTAAPEREYRMAILATMAAGALSKGLPAEADHISSGTGNTAGQD